MNITEKIFELLPLFDMEPHEINEGSCSTFAAMLRDAGFGRDVWGDDLDMDLWSDEIQHIEYWLETYGMQHCFTWYEGKFYDSECPEGCEYPDQLPFYKRLIDYFKLQDVIKKFQATTEITMRK